MSIQEQPIPDEVKAGRLKFENDVLFKYAEDYPKQIDKILVLWDAVSVSFSEPTIPRD
jgi:hypothetical protein